MALEHFRRHSKRVLTAIVGGTVVLVGLILIPYPGPGWLIVFAGLAILATEFEFASKILTFTKGKYDVWVNWLKQQNRFVQLLVLSFTGVVIVITIWFINGFGIIDSVLSLNQDWLVSPLFRN